MHIYTYTCTHVHTRTHMLHTQVACMKVEFRLSRLDTLNRATKSLQPGAVHLIAMTTISNAIIITITKATITIINTNHNFATIASIASSQQSRVERMGRKFGRKKNISIITVFGLGTGMLCNT